MKLNPDQILRGVDGAVLIRIAAANATPDTPAIKEQPWTVRDVVVDALLGEGEGPGGVEKYRRGKLAGRIYEADADNPVELTVEEAASIKKLVERYPTVLMVPMWDILEMKTGKKEPADG